MCGVYNRAYRRGCRCGAEQYYINNWRTSVLTPRFTSAATAEAVDLTPRTLLHIDRYQHRLSSEHPAEKQKMTQEHDYAQIRLLIEELCCDLSRFEQARDHGIAMEDVRVDREFYLTDDCFADIRVAPGSTPPYFLEVKFGYDSEKLLSRVRAKYGQTSDKRTATRLIVVLDTERRGDMSTLEQEMRCAIDPSYKLEIWNESILLSQLKEQFGVVAESIEPDTLLELRDAVDHAKGRYAFGSEFDENYTHHPLHAQLLWHLGFWRIRKLRQQSTCGPRDIFPPGLYRKAIVVVADMCGFSGYVRATEEEQIISDSLTGFYSKARYQIINSGGLFYQFAGDEVIGVFGIPNRTADDATAALHTAERLLQIGLSTTADWQREINLVQPTKGFHAGINVGDLQVICQRPFSRAHMGAVGDNINTAARLMSAACSNEIVISNAFRNCLPDQIQAGFTEMPPVEAKNIGRVRAWKRLLNYDAVSA